MAVFQGHQNFGIHGANRAGIAVGQIDTAVGQANVVEDGFELVLRNDFTNDSFNRIGNAHGFFNAGTRGRAHVQSNLACVYAWEKVTA